VTRPSALCLHLAAAVGAFAAHAQTTQLGDGRDGPLDVAAGEVVINAASPLADDAAAGDPFISVVDATPFQAGGMLLIVQHQWRSDGERYRIGEFAVHAIERVVGNRLELGSSLNRPWRAQETQVVRVPQYTDVTIAAGASVVAPPWNGTSGGVLALMATGLVRNDGSASATGRGLRGGTPRDVSETERGCGADAEPAPRGAMRGEGGLVGTFVATSTGRANADSGGGGGVCQFAGGGGGGSLGEGGSGGFSADGRRDVGGRGGLALTFAGLVVGGGGGAANGAFARGRPGGRGGGAVFIRARALDGSGVITADGAEGQATDSRFGAAGGGGGGGGVVLEIIDTARCLVSAAGGRGGAATDSGPGGGGGGGRVSVRAARIVECPASVAGGEAGKVTAGEFGATAGLPGSTLVREIPRSEPFGAGPGVTVQPLGCTCSSVDLGAWWFAVSLVFRCSRRRAGWPSSRRAAVGHRCSLEA
jgi:hypothetical protein